MDSNSNSPQSSPSTTPGSSPADGIDQPDASPEGDAAATPSQQPHTRVDSIPATEEAVDALNEVAGNFLLEDSYDSVGDHLDDTATVLDCMEAAVEFFHTNLPEDIRSFIHEEWGIQDPLINHRKIGFVDGSNDVVEHLLDKGFDELTISRAGLGTAPVLKHLFQCHGVSPRNADLVPEERQDHEVQADCSHAVTKETDILLRGQLQGLISPSDIDLEAVAKHEKTAGNFRVYNWWDHRITFPYRNREGRFCYLILRATEDTDDIVYSNGVVDREGESVTTLADTQLGDGFAETFDDGVRTSPDEYYVIPSFQTYYNDPRKETYEERVEKIEDIVTFHTQNPTKMGVEELLEAGLIHDTSLPEVQSDPHQTPVEIVPTPDSAEAETEYLVSPPAVGVQPGTEVVVRNRTEASVSLEVAGTPSDVWWEDTSIHTSETLPCDERGMYRYSLVVDGEEHQCAIASYDNIYTDKRSWSIESWVEGEPNAEPDVAKYVKQTIDRDWINRDAVSEPIFGHETVHEDAPLVLTEGVTDALMAHQNEIPCIAPATTNFKAKHHPQIIDHSRAASTTFVLNDNEENKAGLDGALRTAKVLQKNGIDARVAELPRPDGRAKVDLADYLESHTRDDLKRILRDSVLPENHPEYDESIHNPSTGTASETDQTADYSDQQQSVSKGEQSSEQGDTHAADDETTEYDGSEIFNLSLEDVINWETIPTTSGGNQIYRGKNPIKHRGDSEDYFVIRDNGEFLTAKDYKAPDNPYYTPQNWIAVAASCECASGGCGCTRGVRNPTGPPSDSELFWMWRWAHNASHIDLPEDDPVPLRGIWFLADYHDLLPSEMIPDDYEDEKSLPNSVYNEVLEIIREEYGLNPGRERRPT